MNYHTRPFKPGEQREVFPGLENDPYLLRRKHSEPTVCSHCGAVYRDGRWQWLPRPDDAEEAICTACHRIADRVPAGYVYIDGPFAQEHRAELLQLIDRHAQRARAAHPMQRVMSIDAEDRKIVVTTTDVHLARGIGSALKSAFQGELELDYPSDEKLVRVYWRR